MRAAPDLPESDGCRLARSGVLWLTGLPAAGKSTVGRLVARALERRGEQPTLLDGDHIRATVSRDLGFSPADRDENVHRTAEMARRLLVEEGVVIVAMISPLRRQREAARRLIGDAFFEVHVRASLSECIRRDPKGLYAKALAGEIEDFTGVSSAYEAPRTPDVVIDTEHRTPEESAGELLRAFAARQAS